MNSPEQDDPQKIAQDLILELEKIKEKRPAINDLAGVIDALSKALESAEKLDLPKPVILLILSLVSASRRRREKFVMHFERARVLRLKQKQEQEQQQHEQLVSALNQDPEEPEL